MGFYRRRWTNSWLRTRHHQLRPLSLLAHHLQHHCPSPAVPDATRSNTTTTNTFPLTATNTRPKHHTLNRNTTQLIRAVSNFELCIFGLGREREKRRRLWGGIFRMEVTSCGGCIGGGVTGVLRRSGLVDLGLGGWPWIFGFGFEWLRFGYYSSPKVVPSDTKTTSHFLPNR